ncbi:MAG TPA: DUF2309 domain-containing protein [Nitrospiraceae bacterium]|nr:DUF2309 domain-containing protein [Nitrospiraceae bacterium]
MEPITASPDLDARRMELRGTIRLASEVIAQYWPMRTFVHHNPLHSLEYLRFGETVQRGAQFLGGRGYLSGDDYRGYLKSGRIQLHHVDEALSQVAGDGDKEIALGSCRISHREVLRACLTHGLSRSMDEPLDALMDVAPRRDQLEALADHLSPFTAATVQERAANAIQGDLASLGHHMTLSSWCDQTLGTHIVAEINGELIKWCEAFLDEGHAAWAMPGREQGLYGAWKELAAKEWSTCGIADSRRKIAALPEHPEDAVFQSLEALAIPPELRQDYLGLQLAALPGWAGYIKWRAEQNDYVWQQAFPVGLVKFLAIRLWYVRELVQKRCREALCIDGNFPSVTGFMRTQPYAYFMRKERAAGRLPAAYAEQVDRLAQGGESGACWETLAMRYQNEWGPLHTKAARYTMARRLLALAQALELVPAVLMEGTPSDLKTLVDWMDAFPESAHGPAWLKAFEAGYQEQLFGLLMRTAAARRDAAPPVRPQSQSIFCIDVRSEPFRRHLESTGPHETFGFAGFFAVFIRYRGWGKEHDTEQFPVIMRARNEVREIPRSYLDQYVSKHQSRTRLMHAGHTLLHDLKENVVTPYVMVESLGWFYGLPIVGKTALPALYKRLTDWLKRLFVPPIATSLTVDKLSPVEIEEMVLAEQRALIWRALRDRFDLNASRLDPHFVEALRQKALDPDAAVEPALTDGSREAELTGDQLTSFVDELRRHYQINQRSASRQKERITRTGFTLDEQVLTVETALRMMGLVRNFARLVLFCAHGSTTENNPFESALDCGACGGNEGKPNARVIAGMANRGLVRERLAKRGIEIPPDTHFLAGQVNTTTDQVELFDLEDVPPTHRKDVARLLEDLREASRLTSQERCARLPDIGTLLPSEQAEARVRERSADWSQVRPEWGLSGNTAFVIGRRALTKGLNLSGRVFLHSYDYREDPGERLLEVLMTAPQVVAQWINMEHYFSAVDNEVYGSGSKIYHNVVGRFGIMSGPWSDLRLGLAWQTVMNGDVPYHEPMRLLTLIEAPRPRIEKLIARHELLQHFYHNEWVHLAALDPEDGVWYRYMPSGAWRRVICAVST